MEEEKAAAYYEELSRKGEGAAKFKQGLGFSSSSSSSGPPQKKDAPLFSSFVRASSNGAKSNHKQEEDDLKKEDHSRIVNKIHSKLNRSDPDHHHRHRDDDRDGNSDRDRKRDRDDRHRDRSRDRKRERDGGSRHRDSGRKNTSIDYSRLIEGYSNMAPAERVKAKMKLQLSQTAAKDSTMGMSSGWERFDFNKDAPLDEEEEEVEVAADDSLIKGIGKSFRLSAVEAKREEDVQAAHDQAMFGGGPATSPVLQSEPIKTSEDEDKDDKDSANNSSLMSDKVLSMQQGSWRDRARRFQKGPE